MTWLLLAWICTSPGPTGECHPIPDRGYATRAACLRASQDLREASVHVWTRCRLHRPPAAGEGAEAPV